MVATERKGAWRCHQHLRMARHRVSTGDAVEVRTRYLSEQWARGYAITEILPGGVRVRRCGSGEVLGEVFSSRDVRLRVSE